jgi:hypothetical protein
MASKRLQFGTEDKARSEHRPIEGLDAQAIADERQAAGLAIPQRDREHPRQSTDGAVDTPANAGFQKDFGVRMAAPGYFVAGLLKLTPNRGPVVDLAIVGNDEAAVARGHRLMAGGRQVDNRKPPVT